MEPIVISLGKATQVLVSEDRTIKCKRKKDHFLQFRRMPKGSFRLEIRPISFGPLKLRDERNFLLLQYNGHKGSSITGELLGDLNPFNVFMDTSQIADCDGFERADRRDGRIRIEYEINLYVNDQLSDTLKGESFELEIASLDYSLNVGMDVPETELVYATGQGETPAGSLCFSHGSEFNYAAPLRVKFKYEIRHNDEIIGGQLFRLDSVASESNPLMGTTNDINLGTGSVLVYNQKRNEIANLYPNHTKDGNNIVSIPLYIDMSKIHNPIDDDDEKYVLSVSGSYDAIDIFDSSVIVTKSFSKDMTVRVKRNSRFTEMKVFIEKQGAKKRVRDFGQNKVNVLDLAPDTLCAAEGLKVSYKIRVGNMAQAIDPEHPTARVLISNFSYKVVQTGDPQIELKENSTIEDVFRMSGSLLDVKKPRALDCGASMLEMNFDYDPAGIKKISKGYECPVDIRFSFNYSIDLDGILDEPTESYEGWIRTKVELVPNPEWLCVDFGTSAVVASYGDNLTDSRGEKMDILLDLKTAKKNLLKKAYKAKEYQVKQEDKSESAPKLISSMMALNPDNEGDYDELKPTEKFSKSALWFSPSSGMLVSNDYMLPCLKSMVGFKALPEALVKTISRASFNFTKNGENFDLNSYNSPLTRVDTLFEIVYKQLFHLYLETASTAQKRTGCGTAQRLILTYPNTYTPLHLKKVREIAARQLSDLRIDDYDEKKNYLRFISESDAVAFYYLSRRNYLKSRHRDLPDDFDRNILVYDMGAGTLDLTYIVKTLENSETIIDIRGKMGVSKAGNYADYVLGEILCDFAETENDKKILIGALQLTSSQAGANTNSVAFKRYIKSTLKPALNKDDSYAIPTMSFGVGNATEIKFKGNIGDIVNDKRYQQYLQSATGKVFDNFAGIMRASGFKAEENKINIVVFSGRASGLRGLRAAVKKNLEPYMRSDCRFFDISGDDFIDPDTRIQLDEAAFSRLKTVVVDGAMTYATLYGNEGSMCKLKKRNVYSIYGLILERGNSDNIEWKPLITPLSKPLSDKSEEHYGMTVYQYNSTNCLGGNPLSLNLGSYSKMYLVSSYCADTEAAWRSRDMEMISVLTEINLGALGAQNLGCQEIVLEINGQNELQLSIGDLNQTFTPHEDWGDDTFRKSLWPVKLA